MQGDRYLTLKQLSEYSQLAVSTLRYHIKHNGLDAFKPGGIVLVKRSEFDKWMENYRINDYQDLQDIADSAVASVMGEK